MNRERVPREQNHRTGSLCRQEGYLMKRREFLKTTAMATAGLAGTSLHAESPQEKPKVRKYRKLGRTGIEISDVSFGTGSLPSASMILRAIDRGINYFDTAPDYGMAERYIGEAMEKIQRDKIFIGSKMCHPVPYPGHLKLGTKKEDFIKMVEGSLSRMKTDYIDLCFVHAIGEMGDLESEKKRLLDEEMLAAVGEMKEKGMVRHLAVSSHGPNDLEELLLTAIESGHYDVVQPAFNFMRFSRMPDVLKAARKAGVGVIAMKTLAGAKGMDLERKGEAFEPAALRWVLKHPEVSGLIITMKKVSDFDLLLGASGQEFSARDQEILDRYAQVYGKEYCRTGCGDCEPGCPHGVPIASIMRYQMYFKDYGMEKRAMRSYAAVTKSARSCLDCKIKGCDGACTYGLPVREMLREAHESLSFVV
jgi:predicted aldo/keto reductase-like oxidoreductase